jgi:glyoxylase-like metal-dependent hydrolase (beta-lactamase superfamily II)
MHLHILPAGPIQTNAYLLTSPATGEAVLIDAPAGIWAKVKPILENDKCRLTELWLTHGHWDHTQGAAEVVRATGAKVRAHPADRAMYETARPLPSFAGGGQLEPVRIDHELTPGEIIPVLGVTAEVRHVPGHAPGNVLFYFAGAHSAFVGDALFRGSVGRTDLPGGDAALLARSIRGQIYGLPEATLVYPGHGPATTVGEEKAGNPHVRGE